MPKGGCIMKLFIVSAWRWGYREDHHYTLGVFDSLEKAKECVESHATYRGGKYACIVEECNLNHFDNEEDDYTNEVYRAKSYKD